MKTPIFVLLLVILHYSYGQSLDELVASVFPEATTGSSLDYEGTCGEDSDKGLYKCVPYYLCDSETESEIIDRNGPSSTDTSSSSSRTCSNYLEVCCKIPDKN